MKRLDYLKAALQAKYFTQRAWMISAFAVSKPTSSERKPGVIIPEPWGYSVVLDDGTVEKLDDVQPGIPVFGFKERITIDPSWAENAQAGTETTIGNLLFNAIAILPTFGKKFPFPIGSVEVSKLEEQIAPKLQSTPESEDKRLDSVYYVDEYLKFVDALQYLKSLTQLTTIAVTRRSILPPTGRDKFKQELLKKYDGKLTDPVELAKFEKELLAFDNEYLKGDPADGTFVKGKIKHTARKKLFLDVGAEVSFDNGSKVTPIINSLSEGWSTEPKEFVATMNGLRAGSFSRGAETVKGGVSAKYLLRAANNFKIEDTDCGTKLGIRRQYDNESDGKKLIGRYLVTTKDPVLVKKEDLGNYLAKALVVRSPMYCKLKGDAICKVCAGDKLFQYPTGLTIPLTEVSAIILTSSLKKMHVSGVTTAKMDLKSALS